MSPLLGFYSRSTCMAMQAFRAFQVRFSHIGLLQTQNLSRTTTWDEEDAPLPVDYSIMNVRQQLGKSVAIEFCRGEVAIIRKGDSEDYMSLHSQATNSDQRELAQANSWCRGMEKQRHCGIY